MELKAGYKRTTFGIIPEDWNIVEFESVISDLKGGAPFKPTDFTNSGVMVLPKGGVGFGGILRIQEKDKQFCSSGYAIAHSRNQVDQRDTIIVLRDLVPSGPSIGLMVMIPDRQTYVLAQGVYGFRVKEQFACAGYLIQLSNTRSYRKLMNSIMVGSTQVHITNTALKKVCLPFPPIAEQTAIANALSDADSLIGSLQKLIAKKRQIKQGAMQTLLNPFENGMLRTGWEIVKLGDVCDVKDGTHQTPKYVDSGIPFYSVESVTRNDFVNTKFISHEEHKFLTKNFRIEKGDVLMTRIGSIGDCKYVDWAVDASFYVSLALLKVKDRLSAKFLAHYSTSAYFKKEIELNSLQHAIPKKINLGQIGEIKIGIPTDISQQLGLASLLSDMDAEIAALETKLTKYQQIKQGMMQNLLTGRIRLV